jgi:hypothetical protein
MNVTDITVCGRCLPAQGGVGLARELGVTPEQAAHVLAATQHHKR